MISAWACLFNNRKVVFLSGYTITILDINDGYSWILFWRIIKFGSFYGILHCNLTSFCDRIMPLSRKYALTKCTIFYLCFMLPYFKVDRSILRSNIIFLPNKARKKWNTSFQWSFTLGIHFWFYFGLLFRTGWSLTTLLFTRLYKFAKM